MSAGGGADTDRAVPGSGRSPASPAFLGAEFAAPYDEARVAVLPLPFERTVSYGGGTAGGPAAILEASRQVEIYDEQLASEPWRLGIATLPALVPRAAEIGAALAEIEAAARDHLAAGKFLLSLGGEHSITPPLVAAARAVHGEIGVVQLDAHADLRDEYQGTPHSHACVMKRILDAGVPAAAVGIRSLSPEEGELIRRRDPPILWGHQLAALSTAEAVDSFDGLLDDLPETVYLTFDIDYFDPSLVPATGTPEPGGGRWYPTLALLRHLFGRRRVIAMDLVELAPRPEHHASDFLAARLAHKCLAYLQAAASFGS